MRSLLGTKPKKQNNIIHVPNEVERAFGELERARAELEAFRQKNAKVIEKVDGLRKAVGLAEENAKLAYSHHKDKLGPSFQGFAVRRRRSIDAVELVSLQPELMEFVELSITVKAFDELVEANAIKQTTAEKVESYTENITSSSK
jgi:hypothetical protein